MLSTLAMMLSLATVLSTPAYPNISSTFRMSEDDWGDHDPWSDPTRCNKQTYLWDDANQRTKFYHVIPGKSQMPVSTKDQFEFQLLHCGSNPADQLFYLVEGDPAAPNSTYKCEVYTGAPNKPIPPCAHFGPVWPSYWPVPAGAQWNGTDVINGVSCDRFDLSEAGAAHAVVSFWGTNSTPCRKENVGKVPSEPLLDIHSRLDYHNFDASPIPAAEFDLPAWVKALRCTPRAAGAPLPKLHRPF
jgi:hypothetical protein